MDINHWLQAFHITDWVKHDKLYTTSGICGNAGESQGKITTEYIEQQRVGEKSETDVTYMGTDSPCEAGNKDCSYMISQYFSSCLAGTSSQDSYINTCANDYCDSGSQEYAYSTFQELSRMCGEQGCSESWKYWRQDRTINVETPACSSASQVFDDCAPISVPTCSNPVPVKDKAVTSGCTCPEGFVLDDVNGNGNCVRKEDCPCGYNGIVYNSGKKRSAACKSECTCQGGMWSCTKGSCSGKCKIEDGMYFTTFDEKSYSLHGNDKYIAYLDNTNDCVIFAEILQSNSSDKRTYLNSVSIVFGQHSTAESYKVTKDCQISGTQTIDKDYYATDKIKFLKHCSNYIQVVTKDKLTALIKCGGLMEIELILPPNTSDNTQGLCGSFDHNAENDMKSSHGILETSLEEFIRSWRTSTNADPSPPPACVNVDNGNVQLTANTVEKHMELAMKVQGAMLKDIFVDKRVVCTHK
ncbi:mucin-19-like [Microcaecilia unicolor]|uniref:Mucin-19-like n=1 Tax=Microcaecilia unicolor TaxID=1415580 RepID=A0A6P7Z5C5_9AMPH|nr:mucin-19-like [Microcaecilia unicolor]